LRLLADAGWEVGSHTVTHPRLTQLDEHRLAVELDASRAEVERQLGRPCLSLAYPYGDYDERVVSAAGAAGYRHACTLPAALEPERPLAWPRIGIYGTDTPFSYRLKVSRSARRVRASAAWDALSAVRSRIQRSGRTGSATG